jgi:hypothetical protein
MAAYKKIRLRLDRLDQLDKRLSQVETILDRRLLVEIGYHQYELKTRLTLKHLYALNIGSVASVQRRLSRLKRLGLVLQARAGRDRRHIHLTLSPKAHAVLRRLG